MNAFIFRVLCKRPSMKLRTQCTDARLPVGTCIASNPATDPPAAHWHAIRSSSMSFSVGLLNIDTVTLPRPCATGRADVHSSQHPFTPAKIRQETKGKNNTGHWRPSQDRSNPQILRPFHDFQDRTNLSGQGVKLENEQRMHPALMVENLSEEV